MDRETTINYMQKAVACHNEDSTACLGRNCCDCPHDYHVETIELIESALELLEGEEKDRWIPVTERLPETNDTVLITHKGGVSFGWYNSRYWERGANTNHRKLMSVKAWRPLPAPYQEEES